MTRYKLVNAAGYPLCGFSFEYMTTAVLFALTFGLQDWRVEPVAAPAA